MPVDMEVGIGPGEIVLDRVKGRRHGFESGGIHFCTPTFCALGVYTWRINSAKKLLF